ncbi:MAG: hypothetical protein LBR97_02415 [Dysgonamonadaceae bacterium]|jgi:hypothetical protein|nr:hypothetical protein [Dysgonamonadaceae bacterium]
MQKITVFITMLVCSLLFQGKMQAQENQLVSVGITVGVKDKNMKSIMENNASSLLSSFNLAVQKNAKKLKLDDKIATPETKKKIELFWESSKLLCTESEIRTVCRKAGSGELQIRKIPVKMLKATDPNAGIELLSLNFNQTGRICDVNISNDNLAKQIIGISDDPQETEDEDSDIDKTEPAITENAGTTNEAGNEVATNSVDELQTPAEDFAERNKILDIVEKFRTAYNCKDIYYIENIFSNNALIIRPIQKTIQQVPNTDLIVRNIKLDGYGYDFQVTSKQEYIKKLRIVFKKNSFVNVRFDSIQVDKVRGHKIYGVSLHQQWNSTTYNDKGHLFLLIDCRKEDEIQIFIRAWAPEKVFSLNSFADFVQATRY